MKKIKITLLFLATIGMSFSIVSCNQGNNPNSGITSDTSSEHVHKLGEYHHDDHDHWQVCSECNEVVNKESHRGGESNCLHKAICEVCGVTYGELDEHKFGEWIYDDLVDPEHHQHTCEVCNETVTENHVFNKKVVSEKYLIGEYNASCDAYNEYYLSCVCGAHSKTEKFRIDNHHSFTLEEVLADDANLISAATCTEPAVYGKVCEHCHTEFSIDSVFEYGEPAGHHLTTYDELITFSSYHKAYAFCDECNKYFIDISEETASEPVWMEASTNEIFDDSLKQYGNDGYGTKDNPYNIASTQDLLAFAKAVNDGDKFENKHLVMINDISFDENVEFGDCIGKDDNHPFSGIFNGNNFTITNFTKTLSSDKTTPAKDSVALFSRVTNGTIRNLKLKNITVSVSGQRVASLIARAFATTIDNIEVISGTITGAKQCGGIVGASFNNTVVTNCINRAEIISSGTANAGIVAHVYSGTTIVSDCINYGTVTSTGSGASGLGNGGIVGTSNSGTISSSLPNEVQPSVTITNCVNYASITSSGEATGGIMGQAANGTGGTGTVTIDSCINNANVSGTSYGNGGILGSSTALVTFTLLVKGCINNGTVNGEHYVGGIVGLPRKNSASSEVKDCTNNGNVTGTDYVGGIVGAARVNVTNCRVLSAVILTVGTTAKSVTELGLKGSQYVAGYITATIEKNGSGSDSTVTGEIFTEE